MSEQRHYVAPPKVPPTIAAARVLRRRIIPLHIPREPETHYTLWRRAVGQKLSENPVLQVFPIPTPSETGSRRRELRHANLRARQYRIGRKRIREVAQRGEV